MLYYDFDNDFGVFLNIIKKIDIYVLLFIYYIVIIIGINL